MRLGLLLLIGLWFVSSYSMSPEIENMLAGIEKDDVALIQSIVQKNPTYLEKIEAGSETFNPLKKAIDRNAKKVALWLVENGAPLNVTFEVGIETPLLHYAYIHMPELVLPMIDKGIDITTKDRLERTLLVLHQEWLRDGVRFDIILRAVDAGVSVLLPIKKKTGETTFIKEISTIDLWEKALSIADHAVEYAWKNDICARKHNKDNELQKIITYAQYVDVKPLKWALLKFYLMHDPQDLSYRILMRKFMDCRYSYGSWCDADGNTLLHYVVENTHDPYCNTKSKWLLQYGADPNAQNKQGLTPLHVAVRNRNKALVSLLLGFGANITVEDKKGFNAWHYALQQLGPHPQMLLLMMQPSSKTLGKRMYDAGVETVRWLLKKVTLQ